MPLLSRKPGSFSTKDDLTANLDPATRAVVTEHLRTYFKGKTALVIIHGEKRLPSSVEVYKLSREIGLEKYVPRVANLAIAQIYGSKDRAFMMK